MDQIQRCNTSKPIEIPSTSITVPMSRQIKCMTYTNQFSKLRRCKDCIKLRLIPEQGLMLHLKGTVRLYCLLHQRQKRKKSRETHKTRAPGEKYLPSSGSTVSSDLAISSAARIAAIDIQRELKAMYRPGQILRPRRLRLVRHCET